MMLFFLTRTQRERERERERESVHARMLRSRHLQADSGG